MKKTVQKALSILLAAVFALVASDASARDFERQFDKTFNGRIYSVSNSLITCDSGDSRCAGAQDFTGPVYQNGPFQMVNIDVDSDPSTFNSSYANLQLPATSKIVFAKLYWSGQYTDNGAPHKFNAPPDAAAKNKVLFKVPGGNYVGVKGSIDVDGEGFYQGHADVTNLVNGSGFYSVANVQLTTGKQMFGGWTLMVVVESQLEPLRRIVLWDGFLRHETGSQKFALKDTLGMRRKESSVEMNLIQYDGDKGNYDAMLIDSNLFVPKNLYPIDDPAAAGDVANSSITKLGKRFEDRKPFYKNTLGYDDDLFEIYSVLNSDEHLEFEFKTKGDIIHRGVISVQSDVEDRFVQTDWGKGANGTSSSLLNGENGFHNKSGHMFHDTLSGALHTVQFSYTYDGQQYEVLPVRNNLSDTAYYGTWRAANSSVYPISECLRTKYWLYREVDRSIVSWFAGFNRRGAARPACDGRFTTTYSITGAATVALSDDAGESTLTGTNARWWGSYTDGHVIRFSAREFKVEGDAITSPTVGLQHDVYLDDSNNKINYKLNSGIKWSFESDFHGRLESKIFDGLISRGFGNLDIDHSETNNSVVEVMFRTGDSIADVQSKSWEGPFLDGDLLGNTTTNNHRFFQYAVVTTLTDPANNTVESELTFNEISFDLYGIAAPYTNGTWTRLGEVESPTEISLVRPGYSIEISDADRAKGIAGIEFQANRLEEADIDSDFLLGLDSAASCSTSGQTMTWFPLLLAMFWRRRKR